MIRWSLLCLVACGQAKPAGVEDIADRGWRATEVVIAAGENVKTCVEAGIVMAAAVREHRDELVAAFELQADAKRLEVAAEWIDRNKARYGDLETRMEALSTRCEAEPSVVAVFDILQDPTGGKPPTQ